MTDNKLKLDEELVRQLLSEDNVTEADDTNEDIMLERIKNHFDFEITDGWAKNPDMMFYTETTSDGYEVWVATDDEARVSINEDIYYYESDWLEKMPDAMTDGMTIYFQELEDDNYEFQEVVHNVYEEYYNDKRQELIEKLIDDGYEWEEE
jgi:hypothetical protein